MSESEQYAQEQCDSAKSDYYKEMMVIAIAEKAAKRQEHQRDEYLEQTLHRLLKDAK